MVWLAIVLTTSTTPHRIPSLRITNGAIAQLGERLHGMQEVVGSIPISSTMTVLFRPHRLEA